MSIARAFTTRRAKRPEISEPPSTAGMTRAASTRTPGKSLDRHAISSPVELLSTTNMLSYNAPDIQGTPRIRHISSSPTSSPVSPGFNTVSHPVQTSRAPSTSSASSQQSAIDSDSGNASPGSLTDASSVTDSNPPSPGPEPNHLSAYFEAPKGMYRSQSTSSLRSKALQSRAVSAEGIPSIPQRAPSHSKRAHQDLARKRSISRHGSVPNFRDSKDAPRTSAEMFTRGSFEPNHPFGKELDQLIEVAEEFNGAVRNIEIDEDTQFMQNRGLGRYDVNDYMLEISSLYSVRFEDRIAIVEPAWI
ncbi:MAG: hypothetical protein M1820_010103 [Bogoriella megaspora]|nr:MAG: hypothetical protein M1820_010103 [Bogoriella megaspora]